jgi:hypothetical protein
MWNKTKIWILFLAVGLLALISVWLLKGRARSMNKVLVPVYERYAKENIAAAKKDLSLQKEQLESDLSAVEYIEAEIADWKESLESVYLMAEIPEEERLRRYDALDL